MFCNFRTLYKVQSVWNKPGRYKIFTSMKKLACKDIDPSIDCGFVATGATTEEVVGKMMKHVKSEHPDKMMGANMGEMKKMFESAVHE